MIEQHHDMPNGQPGAQRAGLALGMSINAKQAPDMVSLVLAGINCIEITWRAPNMLSPQALEQCGKVIEEARRHSIDVWSLHLPFGDEWDPSALDPAVREEALRKTAKLIDFAHSQEIRTLVIHPSFEPVPPEERAARLEQSRQSLGQLAGYAASRGARLAAECLPRTCLGHSAAEMLILLQDNPKLMVCCDVNHLFKASPASFIRELGSRIVTTHISDNDGMDEQHWCPGDGIIQWKNVLEAFRDTGYSGPVMYEVREHTADQVAANWRWLTQIMQSGG